MNETIVWTNVKTGEKFEFEINHAVDILRACGCYTVGKNSSGYFPENHGVRWVDGEFVCKNKAAFDYWHSVEKMARLWYACMLIEGAHDAGWHDEDGLTMMEDPIGTMAEDITNMLSASEII